MKKMSFIAVSVLMMISASNAFADTTCADIAASTARIEQETVQMRIFEELHIQAEARIIMKAQESKDDSLLLGNGQGRLQAESFQALKAAANSQQKIIREIANRETLKAQLSETCSDSDKGEQLKTKS